MISFSTTTEGRPVTIRHSALWHHRNDDLNIDKQMASLELQIGSSSVDIRFESWDEMIAFCEKHNFSYNDDRTGVEKYLAKMN